MKLEISQFMSQNNCSTFVIAFGMNYPLFSLTYLQIFGKKKSNCNIIMLCYIIALTPNNFISDLI